MRKTMIAAFGAPLLALAIAGCGHKGIANEQAAADGADNAAVVAPSGKTIGAMLGGGDLGTIGDVAKVAGLSDVLEGVGPYTLFAPTDDAFKAIGDDQVDALKKDDMKAQDAALLQAHIVPGFVTTADIASAVGANKGSATMTTMSGGTLTFAKAGDTITVTAQDGSNATLTGDERLGSNGAIHPVSALLVKTATPTG